jgi:nucleoside-diphosphate-sugar epimerase
MTMETDLTVAVTGPTGTFGFGLMPLLQADGRVKRITGVARRPFDPDEHGWSKMTYHEGDVRDPDSLQEAFEDADVVVHLAFMVVGGRPEVTRSINVEGTRNVFRAAAAAGARRFVYASSIAAYGFHRDNPVGMTEEHPVRRARRLFYARDKAEVEQMLQQEAVSHPELDTYLLRPSIVVGPHTVGGKGELPGPVAALLRRIGGSPWRLPVPLPAVVPDVPVQLVHEDDVGRALVQCVVAAGPPGAYNIAADDVLSAVDIAREIGLLPIAVPGRPAHEAARLIAKIPTLPSTAQWVEAFSHPAVMDTTRAKVELDWTPRHSARESLRSALT